MDWVAPIVLALVLPLVALAVWFHIRTVHPMSPTRRRVSLVLRSILLGLILLALAGPAWNQRTREETVIFLMDHSQSQAAKGMRAAYARANALAAALPSGSQVGFVSAGASSVVRRLMLVTDGVQTRGDLEEAARNAAVADIGIDAVPIAGDPRPDVQVVALRASRARLHEGASLSLTADLESSLAGDGRVNLPLLEKACELTGGTLLHPSDATLPPARRSHSRFVELGPFLLALLLALFLADLAIRRWENVLGMLDLAAKALPAFLTVLGGKRGKSE